MADRTDQPVAAGPTTRSRRPWPRWTAPAALALFVPAVALAALALGRLAIPVDAVVRILLAQVVAIDPTWTVSDERVVLLVRLPRVLEGLLIGGGLALCGAALQAVFRNPLVSAQIVGLSSGASVGGALALLLGLGSAAVVGGAFATGMATLVLLFAVTRTIRTASPILVVVLAGVVLGAFASALVSLITYLADPQNELTAIVFWLLGSLATATYDKVAVAAVCTAAGALVILLLRWRVNVLSLGDEEAAALGVRPELLRWTLLTAIGVVVAGAVAVAGVVGWVGLVVPHLARMWVGPDHRVLLPVTFLLGAAYLVVIDTLARTITAGEIPLGVLTALVGAPVFFLLLRLRGGRVWTDA